MLGQDSDEIGMTPRDEVVQHADADAGPHRFELSDGIGALERDGSTPVEFLHVVQRR